MATGGGHICEYILNLGVLVISKGQLKVSKSRKQIMLSSILPKKRTKKFYLRYHRSIFFAFSFVFWENLGYRKLISRFSDLEKSLIVCKHSINFIGFFSGRSLVRLTDNSLLRLEIVITEHRQAILREISKLRLRSNILLLKDIEMKQKQILQQSTEVH